jgi:hypothetical protein
MEFVLVSECSMSVDQTQNLQTFFHQFSYPYFLHHFCQYHITLNVCCFKANDTAQLDGTKYNYCLLSMTD